MNNYWIETKSKQLSMPLAEINDIYQNYVIVHNDPSDDWIPIAFTCHDYLYKTNGSSNIKGIAWGQIGIHWNVGAAITKYDEIEPLKNFHTFSHELGHLHHLGHSTAPCDNFMTSCNIISNYNYTEDHWNTIDWVWLTYI